MAGKPTGLGLANRDDSRSERIYAEEVTDRNVMYVQKIGKKDVPSDLLEATENKSVSSMA